MSSEHKQMYAALCDKLKEQSDAINTIYASFGLGELATMRDTIKLHQDNIYSYHAMIETLAEIAALTKVDANGSL